MNKLYKHLTEIFEKPRNILLLFLSLSAPFLAGAIGSTATIKNIPVWYAGLNKPFFSPPNWIFGPVWTTLYILMGISLFIVIQKQKPLFSKTVVVFLIHLAVNSLWSITFFGMRNPALAFFVILILWYMIFYIIRAFRKIDKASSYLLYPYLAWVTFASFLNLSVWLLNR